MSISHSALLFWILIESSIISNKFGKLILFVVFMCWFGRMIYNSLLITQVKKAELLKTWTLLGGELSDGLAWQAHVDKVHEKASTQLFFIFQLGRTKFGWERYGTSFHNPSSASGRICLSGVGPCWNQYGSEPSPLHCAAKISAELDFPGWKLAMIRYVNDTFFHAQTPSHKLHYLPQQEGDPFHNQRNAKK